MSRDLTQQEQYENYKILKAHGEQLRAAFERALATDPEFKQRFEAEAKKPKPNLAAFWLQSMYP